MNIIYVVYIVKMMIGVMGLLMVGIMGFYYDFGIMRIMVMVMMMWIQVEICVMIVGVLMVFCIDYMSDQVKRINSLMKVMGVEVRVNILFL